MTDHRQLLERARDALQAANPYILARFQYISEDATYAACTKADVQLDLDKIAALYADLTTALAQPRDPQDSVPAWAWRQAISDWWLGSTAGERVLSVQTLEASARELAQSNSIGKPNG